MLSLQILFMILNLRMFLKLINLVESSSNLGARATAGLTEHVKFCTAESVTLTCFLWRPGSRYKCYVRPATVYYCQVKPVEVWIDVFIIYTPNFALRNSLLNLTTVSTSQFMVIRSIGHCISPQITSKPGILDLIIFFFVLQWGYFSWLRVE